MSNGCGDTITLYGTQEALAEAMMTLSQTPEMAFGRIADGASFAYQRQDSARKGPERLPPLHRRNSLSPNCSFDLPCATKAMAQRDGMHRCKSRITDSICG